MIEKLFFDDITVVLRTIIIGIMAYFFLILLLRVSGKRTLSKMNAFDLIVTVALGSILAGIMTSKDVTIAQGVTAFSTLIVLQYILTRLSFHNQFISDLIKSNPALLFYDGQFITATMKKERVLEIEILQAVRSSGKSSLKEVKAVVLETDGTFSVLANNSNHDASAMSPIFKENETS